MKCKVYVQVKKLWYFPVLLLVKRVPMEVDIDLQPVYLKI